MFYNVGEEIMTKGGFTIWRSPERNVDAGVESYSTPV